MDSQYYFEREIENIGHIYCSHDDIMMAKVIADLYVNTDVKNEMENNKSIKEDF